MSGKPGRAALLGMLLLATTGSPQSLASAASHHNMGNKMAHEVNFDELSRLLTDSQNFVLDVREAEEIKADGSIPGSVNIALSRLDSLAGDADAFRNAVGRSIDPSGRNMILSCRSGRRALLALDKIKPLGYDEVKVYKGSFSDWISRGGKVVKE